MAYKYFTRKEYTKDRDIAAPLSEEQEKNMHNFLTVLDQFREKWGKALVITSGYRPAAINAAAGGATKSNHLMCLAVDFLDDDKQSLGKWCLANLPILEELGLYLEDISYTKGTYTNWVHLQKISPRSGRRVFIP